MRPLPPQLRDTRGGDGNAGLQSGGDAGRDGGMQIRGDTRSPHLRRGSATKSRGELAAWSAWPVQSLPLRARYSPVKAFDNLNAATLP